MLLSRADDMPTCKQLLDTCTGEEMNALCDRYDGLYRWNFLRKTTWPEFQPSLPRGLVDLCPKPFDLGSLG